MPEPPATARAILDRIRTLTGINEEGSPENQRRYRDLANTVIGQMLPTGAVKGGAAMYFRYGDASRFSVDLDASQALAVKEFHQAFQERLAEGWGGFTGTITERQKPIPKESRNSTSCSPTRSTSSSTGRSGRTPSPLNSAAMSSTRQHHPNTTFQPTPLNSSKHSDFPHPNPSPSYRSSTRWRRSFTPSPFLIPNVPTI